MTKRSALVWSSLAAIACGGSAPLPAPPPPPAAAVTVPVASSQPEAPVVAVAPPGEDDAGVPVSSRDPAWGSRTALVTIVEFSDFQCPFCSRVEPTLARLRETYGPDDLRIVWKNLPLPFHQNARPAAEAAMGVFGLGGSTAFWMFHARAFAEQSRLGPDAYHEWAAASGVDPAAIDAGTNDHRWAPKVDEDVTLSKKLGAQGTPAFFINGVFLSGAQPIEKFRTIIDDQMEKARSRVREGLPRDRVYALVSRENVAANPKPEVADEDREDTTTVFKVPLGTSPQRGRATALVTIVEFGDFQCPFTGRVQATLADLRATYGDRLRIVFKHEPLPFHPRAEPAAEVALEVRAEKGDDAFWRVHDAIFAHQKDLGDEVLVQLAVAEGASAEKARRAIATHAYKRAIDDDSELADDFQASGTPHFFIDGRRLVGAQPREKFVAIIDEEMKKAQALVSTGIAPRDVYDTLTKSGKGPPEPERKDVRGIPAGDPSRGPAGARVTIHEWSDFQCPFCGRVEPTLADLAKEFGDRVRWVWHDLPLPMHADAPLAAQAGREAFAQRGASAFWTMHDKMFANQKALKRDDLDSYARALGLDMRRWTSALDAHRHDAELKADLDSADAIDFHGTPSFLVAPAGSRTAYVIVGAQPVGKFRRLIRRAMDEAR